MKCEVWSVKCGVQVAKCDMESEVWSVVCEVWIGECEV